MLNQLITIISLKISALTWNETFDLPDKLYNISETQD